MSKLAFTAVAGGATGMIYYGIDIKKYGLNLHNVGMFTGNTLFSVEGVLTYRALTAMTHHMFEERMQFAAKIGAGADFFKAGAYGYRALTKQAQPGDVTSMFSYSLLGIGNYLNYKGAEYVKHLAEEFAKSKPAFKGTIARIRPAITPTSFLLSGVLTMVVPKAVEWFYGGSSKKKK
jgi:hypothetical protein